VQQTERNKRKEKPKNRASRLLTNHCSTGRNPYDFLLDLWGLAQEGARNMTRHSFILGGILAVGLGASAFAEQLLRPIARHTDATAQAADTSYLAAIRPEFRPSHMIRYPVRIETTTPAVRPNARSAFLPRTRWAHKDGSDLWTRAAMTSVSAYGAGLETLVPRDIDAWCPAYRDNSAENRRAFWVGMMSALAKHESTYNPRAVGGPHLWYGLLQIYPPTARGYGCRARTGEALKNPTENLSCAARIMNVTVARDNAIAIYDGRWRGVAADWGPMSNRSKIPDMSGWTRAQSYCQLPTRPMARPEFVAMRPQSRPLTATISTMGAGDTSGF
jgi:hypothetical protein